MPVIVNDVRVRSLVDGEPHSNKILSKVIAEARSVVVAKRDAHCVVQASVLAIIVTRRREIVDLVSLLRV